MSVLLAKYKRAITQYGMSVLKLVESFGIIYLLYISCGLICPISWYLPKKNSKNVVAVVKSGSFSVVVPHVVSLV